MLSVPLATASIGRVIFFAADQVPEMTRLSAAGDAWASEFMPPGLAEQVTAWTAQHPLGLWAGPRRPHHELPEPAVTMAGIEERGAVRRANHVVEVSGASDAGCLGWLAVAAVARGIARELDGVISDVRTCSLRPLDDRCTPLSAIAPSEICSTFSFPTARNRWAFVTVGLGNLGLPEIAFDDVPATQVPNAVEVIQSLRDVVAARAGEHVRGGGALGAFRLGPIEISGLGPLMLRRGRHPLTGGPCLTAALRGQASVALGRVLARRRPGAAPSVRSPDVAWGQPSATS
jgi:hypothetical protein